MSIVCGDRKLVLASFSCCHSNNVLDSLFQPLASAPTLALFTEHCTFFTIAQLKSNMNVIRKNANLRLFVNSQRFKIISDKFDNFFIIDQLFFYRTFKINSLELLKRLKMSPLCHLFSIYSIKITAALCHTENIIEIVGTPTNI